MNFLIYCILKEKNKLRHVWQERLSEISERFVGTKTFYGSQHVRNFFQERLKGAKTLISKKLNLDLQCFEKFISPIKENVYKKIYERLSGLIEEEMENIRVHM